MPKQILSPEQENIVQQWIQNKEPMLVEASAGSGKTRVLTEAVRRVIEQSAKDKFKVLCLTFTNKAADEMMDRLSDIKNRKERIFIGTTHAFALDILKSRKHELGFEEMPHIIDRDADRKAILAEVILSNPLLAKHYLHVPPNSNLTLGKHQNDLLNKCLEFISRKKQQLIWLDPDSESYPGDEWTPGKVSLYVDYNTQIRNQNLIDYDDIILFAWKIMSERPAIASLYRRIYKYVLVDEAQDLSFAQYEFIRSFCGEQIRNILMVGDTHQAIHGYAGASSHFMKEEFVKDYSLSVNQTKKISFNYRSSKAIIGLATELSGASQDGSESYFEGVTEFIEFNNEEDEADWIIGKLDKIVGTVSETYDGELTPDKIAILGRNRFVFNTLIEKLHKDKKFKNLFYLKRGTEILDPESVFLKIFDLGTRILCNERAHIYYNKLLEILGVSKDDLRLSRHGGIDDLKTLIAKTSISYIPEKSLQAIVTAWENIESDINKFPQVLDGLVEGTFEIKEENEKALALEDIDEWREAWSKYIRSIPANAKSMSDFRRFLAMGITQNRKQNGLTLATIHTAKGLEFHIVFLIGAGDGTFPDYRAIRSNNLKEEKNNAYVAVTRAKRELYITYPVVKNVPWGELRQTKSRFFSAKKFEKLEEINNRPE